MPSIFISMVLPFCQYSIRFVFKMFWFALNQSLKMFMSRVIMYVRKFLFLWWLINVVSSVKSINCPYMGNRYISLQKMISSSGPRQEP